MTKFERILQADQTTYISFSLQWFGWSNQPFSSVGRYNCSCFVKINFHIIELGSVQYTGDQDVMYKVAVIQQDRKRKDSKPI